MNDKKNSKKLSLSRETVRNLSDSSLTQVQGGARTYPCASDGAVCRAIQHWLDN